MQHDVNDFGPRNVAASIPGQANKYAACFHLATWAVWVVHHVRVLHVKYTARASIHIDAQRGQSAISVLLARLII
jgi:hypothetical protein